MTTVRRRTGRRAYHPLAYNFLYRGLNRAQQLLGRNTSSEETGHVSGPELLEGVRDLALEEFGQMTISVFRSWGITGTADFGHMVFELIESGEMRKTDSDRLSDFYDVFDFDEAFISQYVVDTSIAFNASGS